jgi:hypothetical protein
MPAVDLAISDVNSHPKMLNGYKLNIIHTDTKVSHLYLRCSMVQLYLPLNVPYCTTPYRTVPYCTTPYRTVP